MYVLYKCAECTTQYIALKCVNIAAVELLIKQIYHLTEDHIMY